MENGQEAREEGGEQSREKSRTRTPCYDYPLCGHSINTCPQQQPTYTLHLGRYHEKP